MGGPSPARPRPIVQSLQEYGRGIAGGLLFSLPLLYTMEVWWQGFIADPLILLVYLALSFAVLLGYNRYSGMRRDANFTEVIVDSIEELGLGLLISAGILYLLDRISGEMPFSEVLGKVVVEGMAVAIGVSIGTAQLGLSEVGDTGVREQHSNPTRKRREAGRHRPREDELPSAWGQLVLGLCGAVLIACNIAPTEEVVTVAIQTPPWKLVALSIVSLALCALILFFSEFVGSRHLRRGAIFWECYGVVSSYALALLVSALLLWFFGRFEGVSFYVMAAQTVVLGFPAALGSSAGRLLIQ